MPGTFILALLRVADSHEFSARAVSSPCGPGAAEKVLACMNIQGARGPADEHAGEQAQCSEQVRRGTTSGYAGVGAV